MVISDLLDKYLPIYPQKNEILYILSEILKKDISFLLAHKDFELSFEQIDSFTDIIERRLKKEPLWYILKKVNFYGLDFHLEKDVLIPRDDTELLVDKALELKDKYEINRVLDLCCGSGAIGISFAKNAKDKSSLKVLLSDISKTCVDLVDRNIALHNLKDVCKVVKSDLFSSIEGRFDLIISNPPYISKDEYDLLSDDIKDYEPALALIAGQDGLDYYKDIINTVSSYLNDGGFLVFEVGYNQADRVKTLMLNKGFSDIEILKDLNKIDRLVLGRLEGMAL